MWFRSVLLFIVLMVVHTILWAQPIMSGGAAAQLDIRKAGENSIRITLKPVSFQDDFPYTPALSEKKYPAPGISLRTINGLVRKRIGSLDVEVRSNPLTLVVRNQKNEVVQRMVFGEDGKLSFKTGNAPVLGMGEGGPKPDSGVNFRTMPVEYDRRGRYHFMQPRWQQDGYGSRNPVALLVGTEGWAVFVAAPWVEVDLRNEKEGLFIPWKPSEAAKVPQDMKNQRLNLGKGRPPVNEIIPGLYDFFVFDAHEPTQFMKDFSEITGKAKMPPKWALGYMQSHRTLEDDQKMLGIVDTFRAKRIPLDAVIYLGTGFTPKGWNKKQPSFEFNPEVFKRDPAAVISDMHARNVKVVVHMVPWDRDKLANLYGNIPAKKDEVTGPSHIQNYWNEHLPLVKAGIDAFWPDEGDWLDLNERMKRHQMYYQGHLSANPNVRPWSLHRNGYPGIAQWGGWLWSGDPISAWKTLETQIAVGLNYSLSIGPFWGSDIGGFITTPELTGELYTRWFQFGAFCASFRSHGQTWRLRLPWGWNEGDYGPRETRDSQLPERSELNNAKVEPIIRKFANLRYQLMPYNYTVAREAYDHGLPMMRSLWMYYPDDTMAVKQGNEYLWGGDMLVAPVFEKGVESRDVYFPRGAWYDWWTNEKISGGQYVSRKTDLSTMPIYVRAGAIIPVDPVRQYTSEVISEPTTLKIYSGSNGSFVLYEDDGTSLDYLKNKFALTQLLWDDKSKKLTVQPGSPGNDGGLTKRVFKLVLIPQGVTKELMYSGKKTEILF